MKLLILLVALTTLVVSCNTFVKEKELCLVSETGRLGCDDPRLDDDNRSYIRSTNSGDVCTNNTDYFETEEEVIDLIKEVKKLRTELRRCQNSR